MAGKRMRAGGRLGVVAVLVTAAGLAYLAQGPSSPALSHYALVKALARGTAVIDQTRLETGEQRTHDVARVDGHIHSNKAPGLAFLALPAYLTLDAAGIRTHGDPLLALWALSLITAVLPATVLLFLVRWVGERLEPGFGTAAAVTLGLGTLLTTFATVFFVHALSALLVFAAFVLLFRERVGEPRLSLVAAAGLLAGYAVTTDYPNALAALVLGIYAVARAGWLRRGLVYATAVLVGLTPLLLYNWWAFGSVTHFSYEASVLAERTSGGDVVYRDVGDAVGFPSFSTFVSLFLSKWGLVTTAPVLALGVAATVVLYRRGRRAEALVVVGIALAYGAFVASARFDPFGQVPPGPRYLTVVLPFLAAPLALAFRALPLPTAVLAAGSVCVAGAVNVTRPHIAWDGDVLYRLVHPSWWSPTVLDLLGLHGWYRVLPLPVAAAAAVACALLATPWPTDGRRELLASGVALVGWSALATQGFRLLESEALGRTLGALLLLCAVLALGAVVGLLLRAPARQPAAVEAATRS